MLILIAGFSIYLASIVAILARSRKPADTESLPVLTGKVLLVHAILAVSATLLLFHPVWLGAGLLAMGLIRWTGLYAYLLERRRKQRALDYWNSRITRLSPPAEPLPLVYSPECPRTINPFDQLAAQIDAVCSKGKAAEPIASGAPTAS